ncbi:DUF6093 family protein [Streptomyces rishiriensis]|uniref:DUF6093 family protein n=1 Tax=Streptomyces rishiriensis TaxID=68264 RepID=UPI0035A2538C
MVEKKILTNKVRIYRPGEPVFNPDTGQYEPGPPSTIYEGPGAIFPTGGPSVVLHLAGQAYVDDTPSRYRLLTPLSAPVASREDTVAVVEAEDESAIGRTWRVVLPAVAGVLRRPGPASTHRASPPRRRGGASKNRSLCFTVYPSSPPSRGCFGVGEQRHHPDRVLPADAGVLRLRASHRPVQASGTRWSSSMTRGCFATLHLSPTHATSPQTRSPACPKARPTSS